MNPRIVMMSSQLPTARSSDLPAVTRKKEQNKNGNTNGENVCEGVSSCWKKTNKDNVVFVVASGILVPDTCLLAFTASRTSRNFAQVLGETSIGQELSIAGSVALNAPREFERLQSLEI